MSSPEKEAMFATLERDRKKAELHDLEIKARRQLADEGRLSPCGTEEDFRAQGRLVCERVTEIARKQS